eukprot:TRINITY_DN5211_c0_g3_i1.p1 TRINITY_DN5211_c0_g3~~TRINITY_DN5211_c0_g3_i1.p1  ORF type:complete len:220 (-),score=43.98 TRINITY_DN5211_c0_g3_i1:122-781(-)
MAGTSAATGSSRPLRRYTAVLISASVLVALRCLGLSFVAPTVGHVRRSSPVSVRASIMDVAIEEDEDVAGAGADGKGPQKKVKRSSQYTEEEEEERRAKAIEIFDSVKPDIEEIIERYQTFRPDKVDAFLKEDERGIALFEIYPAGSPEYGEFFEEVMGPYLLEVAKGKLNEGLNSIVLVVVVFLVACVVLAYFGTDIIQGLTAPFTGFATEFTELYGF